MHLIYAFPENTSLIKGYLSLYLFVLFQLQAGLTSWKKAQFVL